MLQCCEPKAHPLNGLHFLVVLCVIYACFDVLMLWVCPVPSLHSIYCDLHSQQTLIIMNIVNNLDAVVFCCPLVTNYAINCYLPIKIFFS